MKSANGNAAWSEVFNMVFTDDDCSVQQFFIADL